MNKQFKVDYLFTTDTGRKDKITIENFEAVENAYIELKRAILHVLYFKSKNVDHQFKLKILLLFIDEFFSELQSKN